MITFEELRSDRSDASVRIHGAGDPFELWFRVHGARPQLEAEALVALTLPVAMGLQQDIDLGGLRLDESFAATSTAWQEAFATWYPDRLAPIALRRHRGRRTRTRPDGVGCFFTGGVDSFHSVLANRDRLTHLVFVHGFDVPLEGLPALRADVTEHVQTAALELGLPLIEVETNLHDLSDTRQSPWGTTYHGVALAAVAHLLSGVVGEMIIGATHAFADLFPYGSHPMTDPLLSSSGLRLVHHGCEADRVEKTRTCAASPVAMRHLRVCWENRDGTYNCGTCKKCLRTMIALAIAGNLESCATLPHTIDLDAVRALPLGDVNTLARHAELIHHLREEGTNPALLEACEAVIEQYDPRTMQWGSRDWTSAIPLLWQ